MKKKKNVIDEILMKDGWWPCKFCSNKNWKMYHKPSETTCSKTGKPRAEAELKGGE